MPARKKLISATLLNKSAEMFATETASRRALEQIGIPASRYPALRRAADEELAVFKSQLSSVLEDTAKKMAMRLNDQADKLPLSQLPVSLGIVLTKHSELNAVGPGHVHNALHIHLGNGVGSALRAILGPAGGGAPGQSGKATVTESEQTEA